MHVYTDDSATHVVCIVSMGIHTKHFSLSWSSNNIFDDDVSGNNTDVGSILFTLK